MPDFDGLGAFITALQSLAADITAAQQRGREAAVDCVHAAVITVFEASADGDTGPFPARTPLADATQIARARHGFAPDEPELATGTLLGSIQGTVEADGRAAVGVMDSMVGSGRPGDAVRNIGDVAVAQEEGTGTVPQRSFLGIGGFRAAQEAVDQFVCPVIAVLAGSTWPKLPSRGDATWR